MADFVHRLEVLKSDAATTLRRLSRESTGAKIHKSNNLAAVIKGVAALLSEPDSCGCDCREGCNLYKHKNCTFEDREMLVVYLREAKIWLFRNSRLKRR